MNQYAAYGAERQEVRAIGDARKLGEAAHLDRNQAGERATDRARPAARCATGSRRPGSSRARRAAETRAPCGSEPQTNSSEPRPNTRCCLRIAISRFIQFRQREGRALLRFDVDRLIAVHRIHDRRREEARRIGAREAAVAIAAPLHRRADAVAVAEIDVVAHADLVAVVDDRRAGKREEQRVQQLDAAPAVLDAAAPGAGGCRR